MVFLKNYFKIMLRDLYLSTNNRLCVQQKLFCISASIIAIIMTILNIVEGEFALGIETAMGAIVSIAIFIRVSHTKDYLFGAIFISIIFLIFVTIFVVSGAVEGFAALWFCLYPFICLFLLNIKLALCFTLFGFIILIICLWTPVFQMLPQVYTGNFVLRFPMLYIGNFVFAITLNGFYAYTYNRLLALNRKFKILSNQDGLTKLANRISLEQYKKHLVNMKAHQVSAIMIDVDYFKQYNDTYGHIAGDDVLKSIAGCITNLLPNENALAVRYGGEEFLIVVDTNNVNVAIKLAENLRKSILNLHIPHSSTALGYVSISLGVGKRNIASNEDFQELLKDADNALYCAKQSGRNCVQLSR